MTRFIDNPIRRRYIQKPWKIADRLELEPGMTVLEIGPGKGSYTIEVAKRVHPGTVYAFDISPLVVETLGKRLEEEGIENIKVRVEDVFNLTLPDESMDRVFMIACLPEIPNPVGALKELRRVLKPDGLLSTSEALFDPDYPWMRTERRWAAEAGYKPYKEYFSLLSYQLVWVKNTHTYS